MVNIIDPGKQNWSEGQRGRETTASSEPFNSEKQLPKEPQDWMLQKVWEFCGATEGGPYPQELPTLPQPECSQPTFSPCRMLKRVSQSNISKTLAERKYFSLAVMSE